MLLWSGVGGQLSQPFSADLLSHHVAVVRGWWSAFGGQSQQIFSADFLSRSSSADLLSRSSHQIFSAVLLSRSSQQIFSANLLSYHVAVVRGWWSAITAILSRSSQPSCCCGQGLVVSFWWSAIVLSFAVVRGWWSAIILSCWWSILHEFFRRTLSRSFREKRWKSPDSKITGHGEARLLSRAALR